MRQGGTAIEAEHDVGALAGPWEELAEETGATPFVRPGWVGAWWDAFGAGKLELVTARRDGRLVGAVPLRRARGAVASPTNHHTPEFAFVAADDEVRRALAQALVGRAGRSLAISYLPAGEADERILAAEAEASGWTTAWRVETSPFVDLRLGWEAYERSLSGNLRNDVRRRRRRLAEAGEVTLDVSSGEDGLEGLLDEGFGVEGSGWKVKQGTAIASDDVTRRFYTRVARWAAERGWLRLCFLRLDGRAIAFHFDLEAGGVLYHLKGGYDPESARHSPSKVLHHMLLERAFASGGERYDFLGGDEPYKAQFSTGARELRLVRAFAPTAAGSLERAAFRYARPLAKRLRTLVRARG